MSGINLGRWYVNAMREEGDCSARKMHRENEMDGEGDSTKRMTSRPEKQRLASKFDDEMVIPARRLRIYGNLGPDYSGRENIYIYIYIYIYKMEINFLWGNRENLFA